MKPPEPTPRAGLVRSAVAAASSACALVLTLVPPAAPAAREIDIVRDSILTVSLTPLDGSSGNTATDIIRSDLENSGAVRVSDAPGSHRVSGTSSGARIEGTLAAPDGSTVFQRTYGGPTLRINAHRFADDILAALTGRPGIASGTIAFVSTRSGHKEIHVCDSDGANIRKITSDGALCVGPSISADGSMIAFTAYRSGYPDIHVIDLLTGSRRRIIDAPGTNSGVTISPDGQRIALTMSFTGNTELYVAGIGGGRGRRLTRTSGVEASPTWSPDGSELIYAYGESGAPRLMRIGAGGGRPSAVPTGFGHCTEPDWSPDGRRLAFNVLSGGGQKIAVLEFDSGRARFVADGENPSWGADSRHLAFTQNGRLVVFDVDGGTSRTIVSASGRISEPSWTH